MSPPMMALRSKTRQRYVADDRDLDRPAIGTGTASYQLAWILVVLVSFLTVGIILHSGDHVVVSFQLRPAQLPLERQKAAVIAGPKKHSKLTAAMAAKSLNSSVAGAWYPPAQSWITSLDDVVNGTGVHGFVFNSSFLPEGAPYGTYNWCNMPHVRAQEYPVVSDEYRLEYVEVIHRHHKRTPYAANTFPRENYPWSCDDEGLFHHAQPLNPAGNVSAPTYWSVYTSPANPFAPTSGFNGSCLFPQITRGGLDDAYQHGLDLWAVYGELLGFLQPHTAREQSVFRVTNNAITSQVASMLVPAFFANASQQQAAVPLLVQPATIDSLEPAYTCSAATALAALYGVGSSARSSNWTAHLAASSPLFAALDAISGVNASSAAWHQSWDHYFDSLSSRLCHAKPLPCRTAGSTSPADCISPAQAAAVFRLGQWEYSYLYRGAVESLAFAVGGFGVWVGELAASLRGFVDDGADDGAAPRVRFRHNTAHDGSIARLLALLQVEHMVWPGMGAEVVFELYARNVSVPVKPSSSSSTASPSSADAKHKHQRRAFSLFSSPPPTTTTTTKHFLRVLWNGQVLHSSHPALGKLDMVDAEAVLAYFDALGTGARVAELCG